MMAYGIQHVGSRRGIGAVDRGHVNVLMYDLRRTSKRDIRRSEGLGRRVALLGAEEGGLGVNLCLGGCVGVSPLFVEL